MHSVLIVALSLLGAAVLGISLILVRLYRRQQQMVFPVTRFSAEELRAYVAQMPPGKVEILAPFDALVFAPDAATPVVGTAVWFHGNGGTALNRARFASVFAERGYRLVLAEYPGYGARDGVPSEQSVVEDATQLVLAVREHYPAEPVTLVGESLGSGVAVQVAAALMKKPARLVLLTPFVSLVDIARKVFPWVPVELLLRHRFESNRQLLEYKGPVSVLIAGRDEVLGADQGRALGAIAHSRGPTAVVEIAEASHSDWCDRITESQWSELLTTTPTPLAA